mgnify:CR=1 FL=1
MSYIVGPHNELVFEVHQVLVQLLEAFFQQGEPKSRLREYIREQTKKLIGLEVDILPITVLVPYFKKQNLPLFEKFLGKLDKIKSFVYIAVPAEESKSFFGSLASLFTPKTKSLNINIAGYYDIRTKTIVLTTLLVFYKVGTKFSLDSLPNVSYTYLYRVLLHELTHYIFHRNKGFVQQCIPYLRDFYKDYFSRMISNPNYINELVKNYEDAALDEEKHTSSLAKSVYRKLYALRGTKDITNRQLLEETLEGIMIMFGDDSSVAMKLRNLTTLQKTFEDVYHRRGITGVNMRVTIFGQELISPSEIMSLTVDHFVLKNKISLHFANLVLTYL